MNKLEKTIDIIGVCQDLGASKRGCDLAPKAIRVAGLVEQIAALGYTVSDCGDIFFDQKSAKKAAATVPDGKLNYLEFVNEINAELFKSVSASLKADNFPLVIGGDHSIAVGSIMAMQKHFKKVGIIWVDAHGDYNDENSSDSGNIHGMPLSSVTGGGPSEILPFMDAHCSFVDPRNVALIGARALDSEEKRRLIKAGVSVFSMEEVDKNGINYVLQKAVKIASNNTEGIYLSFDLDSVDQSVAPGVGTPVKGGLTYREAHFLCEYIAGNSKLLGLEMVELNPILDTANQTAELAVDLIASCLGKTII